MISFAGTYVYYTYCTFSLNTRIPCSPSRSRKKVQSRTVRPAFYDFFRRDVRILYVLYLQSEYPNTLQPAQEPEGGPEQDTQAGIL